MNESISPEWPTPPLVYEANEPPPSAFTVIAILLLVVVLMLTICGAGLRLRNVGDPKPPAGVSGTAQTADRNWSGPGSRFHYPVVSQVTRATNSPIEFSATVKLGLGFSAQQDVLIYGVFCNETKHSEGMAFARKWLADHPNIELHTVDETGKIEGYGCGDLVSVDDGSRYSEAFVTAGLGRPYDSPLPPK